MEMKLTVTMAENLVKQLISKEIKEDSNYRLVYQATDKLDESWDTIYKIGLYEQVGYYPVRNNIDWIIDMCSDMDNVEIINWDEC